MISTLLSGSLYKYQAHYQPEMEANETEVAMKFQKSDVD